MITIKVDIVGGSISGLTAAKSLKENKKSIKVVVHEKYKEIGYNHEGRRCGEAHSIENIWKKWKPEAKSIFNNISTVETTIGKKKYVVHRAPNSSCILNRQEFICQLGREAEKLDVIIQTDDKIKTINDLDSDYIIDASGCPSSIRRELGIDKGMRGITYQQTLEDSNYFKSDTVRIHFTDDFGYYWIFPRDPEKKEINLGVGLLGQFECDLKEMLEQFKKEHNIEGKVNYVLGGPIPGGLQRPLKYKNILFVGDAGVGAFPLTGQGIYRALLSGEAAGKCIALDCPRKYPYLMNRLFIKWDVVGKSFVRLIYVLREVGPKSVELASRYFMDFHGKLHQMIH